MHIVIPVRIPDFDILDSEMSGNETGKGWDIVWFLQMYRRIIAERLRPYTGPGPLNPVFKWADLNTIDCDWSGSIQPVVDCHVMEVRNKSVSENLIQTKHAWH